MARFIACGGTNFTDVQSTEVVLFVTRKSSNCITNFFSDECSELWLKFVHNQASIFHNTVKKMESDNISFAEVSDIFFELKEKLASRLQDNFIPIIIKQHLFKLEEEGLINRNYFMEQVRNFFQNCIQYLDKYSHQYDNFQKITWIRLNKPITWDDIVITLQLYKERVQAKNQINEDEMFDEVHTLKSFLTNEVLSKWREGSYDTVKRWQEIFEHFDNNSIPYSNLLLLIQYVFCLPGTNGPIERVFSLVNAMWTSEKTALKIETVHAMLQVKFNMGKCEDFYEILNSDSELLKKIHSVQKYDFKRQ